MECDAATWRLVARVKIEVRRLGEAKTFSLLRGYAHTRLRVPRVELT